MAAPGAIGQALKGVFLDSGYRASREHEAFDAGSKHKQFYSQGPRLADTAHPGKYWHDALWEYTHWIGYEPGPSTTDPDRRRFELADDIDALLEEMGKNTTISADEFAATSADPVWAEDDEFWVVQLVTQHRSRRSY